MKYKLPSVVEPVYYKSLHPIGNSISGELIFSESWDVCIILDACRYDLLTQLLSDEKYGFIDNVEKRISVDSKTDAWTKKTFTRATPSELCDLTYVTANPFSREIPDSSQLQSIDHVWEYGWDSEEGTVLPRVVTDRAIDSYRTKRPDSMLIHYLQPHVPFVPWDAKTPLGRGNFGLDGSGVDDAWQQLRNGELSIQDVWSGYTANLRYVLDEVKLLLNNIDAQKVVITSDHGNGVGEWGVYGHPIHMPFSCVRRVPWVTTTAEDQKTHSPEDYVLNSETTTEEKLNALGYIN